MVLPRGCKQRVGNDHSNDENRHQTARADDRTDAHWEAGIEKNEHGSLKDTYRTRRDVRRGSQRLLQQPAKVPS